MMRTLYATVCLVLLLANAIGEDPPSPSYAPERVMTVAYECASSSPTGWDSLHKQWCCKKFEDSCTETNHPLSCTHALLNSTDAEKFCCLSARDAGCSYDVVASHALLPAYDKNMWIDFGKDKACRADRWDYTGDGRGTVKYEGSPYNESVHKCMDACADMFKSGSHCHGVEYKWGHCELWTESIRITHYSPGFFCLHYSSSPVMLQGANEDFLVVNSDGSVSRGTNRGARSAFHRITHPDHTVSFLGHNGKYLSARRDGSVKVVGEVAADWETFVEKPTGAGHDTFSYRTWQKRYLQLSPEDGYLKTSVEKNQHITVTAISNPVGLYDAQHRTSAPSSMFTTRIRMTFWEHGPSLAIVFVMAVLIGAAARRQRHTSIAVQELAQFSLSSVDQHGSDVDAFANTP